MSMQILSHLVLKQKSGWKAFWKRFLTTMCMGSICNSPLLKLVNFSVQIHSSGVSISLQCVDFVDM